MMVSFMLLLWNTVIQYYDDFKRTYFYLQFNLTICAQIIIKYVKIDLLLYLLKSWYGYL